MATARTPSASAPKKMAEIVDLIARRLEAQEEGGFALPGGGLGLSRRPLLGDDEYEFGGSAARDSGR